MGRVFGETAAGDKDVQVAGGGSTIQQALPAGVLDELLIHVASHLRYRSEK